MNLSTLLQNPAILNEIVNTLTANPQLTLQLLESAAPALMLHLENAREALYKVTTKDQQLFVSQNMGSFAGFLNTKAGSEAVSAFIARWGDHVLPSKEQKKEETQ